MNITTQSPLTWMDVSRRFAEASYIPSFAPQAVTRVRVGWYGVTIEVASGFARGDIVSWLNSMFPSRIVDEPLRLSLEGPPQSQELVIELEVIDEPFHHRQSLGVIDGVIDFRVPISNSDGAIRKCPVVAALSVKGGTGRTASAISFASSWAELTGKPILIVDADIEAPGVSFLFEKSMGTPKVSLEDLVVLAHAEDKLGSPETIAFVAERLRDHRVLGNIFVLPIRRNLEDLTSPSLRPEHLSSTESPFALGDMLSSIGQKLGCAGVVIDVRAGMVPLGIHLAMDPSVSPIVVTTLSDQSLRATSALIKFVSREIRRAGGHLRKPLLIVNRVPSIFIASGLDSKLIEPLAADLVASLIQDQVEDVSSKDDVYDGVKDLEPFSQIVVPELIDLQVSSSEWGAYRQQMTGSGFDRHLSQAFESWIRAELQAENDIGQRSDGELSSAPLAPDQARKLLEVYAEQLIAAENAEGQVPKPLVTQPLAALTGRFKSEVPIAVSEGGKGTGKTLAARYLVSQGRWETAVSQLLGGEGAVSSAIVPVCASIQSSSKFQAEVDEARALCAESLLLPQPMKVHASTAWLKEQLAIPCTEREWTERWLDVIAWCSGFEAEVVGAGERFLHHLRDKKQSIVALIEGLEELYATTDDPGIEVAMRAVLVSLPQRLRSESKRPMGIIVFARRDTVESAVKQNLDQYRREYAQFALSWGESDVLELAAWLATQSGAIPGLWTSGFNMESYESMVAKLDVLWGRKLGPDDLPGRRTREAYTAAWIVAVLSDLRGRLVPRDLVRFLAGAAKQPVDQEDVSNFATRLLSPRALKGAVESTSTEKVKETEEEIRELGPIFKKFAASRDQVAAPLGADAIQKIGLNPDEIGILVRHGIVYGDAPPYEVPELYRRGLGLRHAGARQSVVNLYRKARQK